MLLLGGPEARWFPEAIPFGWLQTHIKLPAYAGCQNAWISWDPGPEERLGDLRGQAEGRVAVAVKLVCWRGEVTCT